LADHAALAIENAQHAEAEQRLAAAAREEQVRFRAIVENSGDGITLNDRDGRLTYVSSAAARMFGCAVDELLGRDHLERVHKDDRADAAVAARRVRETPSASDRCVHRVVRPDGTVQWIEVTRTNRLEDPAVRAVVCNLRDVTERHQAEAALAAATRANADLEAQLRQAQKMEAVGRLAGGVAHDFNNMLAVILSYGDLLLGDMDADDPRRADVEEIQKAGHRAAALTRQLLTFSRQHVTQPRVVDVAELVVNMDKMLRRIVGEDVEIVVQPRSTGGVLADPSGVEQVVMNLVVNARDAMPAGGTLTIATDDVVLDEAYARDHVGVVPGPYVMLLVSDTGVGMDAATLSHAFDPFFTTKEMGKGTGLGLSTVFGIVTQSRGTIAVESEPGWGATFRIYLPGVERAVDAPVVTAAPSAARGCETILLVEDEDQVRTVARGVLERSGYEVLEARTAAEAIAACDGRGGVDLLLSDVVMPQTSGVELAARLLERHPRLSVLCMSGYGGDAVVCGGAPAGGFALLPKPFTPEALTR
ncbi:MAG TPA: PAS domain S-box protein, partial [Minicystis sp.]|nr:PAS domain S-box protein [Minicystis sp.]